MANMLAQLFGGSAKDIPIGQGLASQARDTSDMRNKYKQYVISTQSEGSEPMSFEEWSKQNA